MQCVLAATPKPPRPTARAGRPLRWCPPLRGPPTPGRSPSSPGDLLELVIGYPRHAGAVLEPDAVIAKPSPSRSIVTLAVVSTLSGSKPARPRFPDRAIEKQPACAAAISSSGLVPSPVLEAGLERIGRPRRSRSRGAWCRRPRAASLSSWRLRS